MSIRKFVVSVLLTGLLVMSSCSFGGEMKLPFQNTLDSVMHETGFAE